jgi:hypothetical protein
MFGENRTYASTLRGNLVDEQGPRGMPFGIEAKLHDEKEAGCNPHTKMVLDHHDQALAKTTT